MRKYVVMGVIALLFSLSTLKLLYNFVDEGYAWAYEKIKPHLLCIRCEGMSYQGELLIKDFIENYFYEKSCFLCMFSHFQKELKQACPFVSKIAHSFECLPFRHIFICVACEPVSFVNKSHILTRETNQLFNKNLFNVASCTHEISLPSVPEDTCFLDACTADFIRSLSDDECQRFSFTYHGPHFIVAQPQNSDSGACHFYLNVREELISSDKRMVLYEKARKIYEHNKNVLVNKFKKSKQRERKIAFDFRFDKRVIVRFL